MKYLKQAARLGDGMSHFFLYSIYKNGIGMDKNLLKVKGKDKIINLVNYNDFATEM